MYIELYIFYRFMYIYISISVQTIELALNLFLCIGSFQLRSAEREALRF